MDEMTMGDHPAPAGRSEPGGDVKAPCTQCGRWHFGPCATREELGLSAPPPETPGRDAAIDGLLSALVCAVLDHQDNWYHNRVPEAKEAIRARLAAADQRFQQAEESRVTNATLYERALADLRAADQQLAALRADKERLDWLDSADPAAHELLANAWRVGRNLREAIDAALTAPTPGDRES